MKSLQNFKTSIKLITGFSFVIALLIIIAVTAYTYLNSINGNLATLYLDRLLPLRMQSLAQEGVLYVRGDVYKYMILSDQRASIRQDFSNYGKMIESNIESYRATWLTPEEEQAINAFKTNWQDYQKEVLTIYDQVDAENMEPALQSMREGKANQARSRMQENLSQLRDINTTVGDQLYQESKQEYEQASTMIIIAGILSVILALIAGVVIGQSIVGPLTQVARTAQGIADGKLDLSAQVDIDTTEEVGMVAAAFNRMTQRVRVMMDTEREQKEHLQAAIQDYSTYLDKVSKGDLKTRLELSSNGRSENDPLLLLGRDLNNMTASLCGMIAQIRSASDALSQAAAEILAATTQQVAGASEQSAAIAQTTTTVDEVKAIAEQTAVRAKDVTETVQRSVDVSRSGQRAVKETILSMGQIKDRVEGIAENILALSEQTQQIGEIIATVNDIASQSNMLALNASVEAARAGEHGKGFAVVASEVRTLAEQSRAATAQVKTILSEIQRATNATVMATEEGTKGVDQGVQLSSQAQLAIERLSGVINENAQASMQMSVGGQQQVAGIDQLAMAMQNINQATIQSLASTRQAEKAAQNLNELSRKLNAMVMSYQIE